MLSMQRACELSRKFPIRTWRALESGKHNPLSGFLIDTTLASRKWLLPITINDAHRRELVTEVPASIALIARKFQNRKDGTSNLEAT